MKVDLNFTLSELNQLAERARGVLGDAGIPSYMHNLCVADLMENNGAETPERRRGLSLLEVYNNTKDHVRMGVFGAALLRRSIPDVIDRTFYGQNYYNLNRRLAQLIVHQRNKKQLNGRKGWTVFTGAGPGMAMHGLQHCIMDERKLVEGCVSLCGGVKSALGGEEPHVDIDPEATVRMQRNIFTRELVVLALTTHGRIFYVGSKGTFTEIIMSDLIAYTAKAGLKNAEGEKLTIDMPITPAIYVDHQRKRKRDGWFYDSYIKFFEKLRREFFFIKPERKEEPPIRIDAASPDAAEQIIVQIQAYLESEKILGRIEDAY